MRFSFLLAAAVLLVGTPTAQALAQPVTLQSDVKVITEVIDENGETQIHLEDPGTIVPGDRLIFGTDYSNSGAEAVENFVLTSPLPGAVRLAPDADPELVVSVDGGTTWGHLADLRVTAADGTVRVAGHGDVTHIRWTLPLVEPGAAGRLEYPAIIR